MTSSKRKNRQIEFLGVPLTKTGRGNLKKREFENLKIACDVDKLGEVRKDKPCLPGGG
jgi:hypothetical protein